MGRQLSAPSWVLGALIGYAGVVAAILLLPVGYGDITNAIDSWIRFGLGITFFGAGWVGFVANILMFVPLGFLLTLLFRDRWRGASLALVLSVIAELAQAFIPSREPSLRDVLANAMGAAVGAGVAWLIVLRRQPHNRPVAGEPY